MRNHSIQVELGFLVVAIQLLEYAVPEIPMQLKKNPDCHRLVFAPELNILDNFYSTFFIFDGTVILFL